MKTYAMQPLCVRSLTFEIGASTAPIFTAFESIEEVKSLVIEKAEDEPELF